MLSFVFNFLKFIFNLDADQTSELYSKIVGKKRIVKFKHKSQGRT